MPYYKDTNNALHFLDDAAFASILPAGSVEITDAEALAAQAAANVPSLEVLVAEERFWRDGEIATTDPVVARQRDQVESGLPTTLTADQYKALQTYRQALRDWPESTAFPDSTKRPVAPEWLAAQVSK